MNSCGRKIFFWATYLNAVWIINEWNGAETLTLQITFWYPFATEFVAFWYLWDNDKFSKQVDNVKQYNITYLWKILWTSEFILYNYQNNFGNLLFPPFSKVCFSHILELIDTYYSTRMESL